MGIEGLYTISVRREGVGAVFDVALDASHPIFAGHFPELPVLPGVCTMHMVKSCAAAAAGYPLRYAAVAEVKFLAPVIPGGNTVLEVRVELGEPDADGCRSFRAEVAAGGETVFKIKSTVAGKI